ncbi:MAG TPA: lipopolysaccharide transport periplasmic protein LptA [Steroidobacteraceae bacterium]|jgi:lipopolysaccharide transport protein LptA|nr:lipopolysaccharide transport periplasmic protein LptA [Steroidobacteraceae bacterium]
MAVSSPGKLLALAALLAPLAQANAAAVARDRQADILLDSQSVSIDLKTNSAVFTKIRISQGGMSITADQGQANEQRSTDLYFENNVWNFRGNVKITVEQGQLFSDDAQITFVNNVLSKAVVNGKPASFEQTVTKTGKPAKGHAETIDYDAAKHLVRFLKNAYVTNGDHEMLGQSVKYDILGQKVIADEAEQNSQRVHIIITPPPPKTAQPKSNP